VHHDTAGEIMGRGDARTRKGKIFKGSYGKTRPHRAKKGTGAGQSAAKTPARRSS
jgi:30S ribosomal protein S31